jgi:hypothetical protein
MEGNNRKTVVIYFLIVLLIAAWVIGFGCWPFLQWSPLNRWDEQVDINSGRIRRQWELAGIHVSKTIEETSISRMLAGETADKPAIWRTANTFSPLVHYSPHHQYHSAIYQLYQIELYWKMTPFTEEARKQTARDILALWQLNQGDDPVFEYLQKIGTLTQKKIGKSPIDAGELPSIQRVLEKQ